MSGLFNLINIPFSYVIRFFYSLTGNYIVALFGFALIVKIVLFPLGIKQQKNMVKQASLRPREMAIRAKYAGRNDKATQDKLNQEVMALYQAENYNPASGCLPLIVQLIIVLAIYQIVYGPLTYLCSMSAEAITALKDVLPGMVQSTPDLLKKFQEINVIAISDDVASFRGNEIQLVQVIKSFDPTQVLNVLKDTGSYSTEIIGEIESVITNLPNMMFLGSDLSETPTIAFNALLIVPILNLVATWGTTKITKKLSYQAPSAEAQQNNASMKIMEYGMPLMIFWMAFRLPAALGVYWIFQNVLGIGQSFLLYKLFPYPTFTEEEMKAAAKAVEKKDTKPEKKKNKSGTPVRSLHHIDDDDEPAPEKHGAKKETGHSAEVQGEQTEEAGSAREGDEKITSVSGVEHAPLKKD